MWIFPLPIPGPSSPIAALTASGLPTDAFIFFGYVPRKQGEREALFESLRLESRSAVGFEVPNRLLGSLEDLIAILGGERSIVLCRELTKLHEQFIRGSLHEVLTQIRDEGVRGEYTLILGGVKGAARWTEEEVRRAVTRELEEGASRSDAAKAVAVLSGWSRKQIYQIGLEEE